MDRRRFLGLLAAAAVVPYVPKRTYFFGPWQPAPMTRWIPVFENSAVTWVRVETGPIARPTGDSAKLQQLIDQARGTLRLPKGSVWLLDAPVVLPDHFLLDGGGSVLSIEPDAIAVSHDLRTNRVTLAARDGQRDRFSFTGHGNVIAAT